MTKHLFLLILGVALSGILPVHIASAEDMMLGCCSRPACGKVCQLVREKKKLTVYCYGYDCKEICLPGPSRVGCKRCETCCDQAKCEPGCEPCGPCCQPQQPACKFYWRDWFACGCAAPRTVKVLTKYQVEKKIDWYHWKVVDAVGCGCAACCGTAGCDDVTDANSADGPMCVYKPAPLEASLGDALEFSDEERLQLEQMTAQSGTGPHLPMGDVAVLAGDSEPLLLQIPAAATSQLSSRSDRHGIARHFTLGD